MENQKPIDRLKMDIDLLKVRLNDVLYLFTSDEQDQKSSVRPHIILLRYRLHEVEESIKNMVDGDLKIEENEYIKQNKENK